MACVYVIFFTAMIRCSHFDVSWNATSFSNFTCYVNFWEATHNYKIEKQYRWPIPEFLYLIAACLVLQPLIVSFFFPKYK